MGTGIFGIGMSALNAAQTGLLTAGHNISNAATPGFHRQEIVQRAALPQVTGAGYIGNGVEVATVKRMYNEFLAGQVVHAQGQAAQLDTYYGHIKQLDDMLGDSTAGLAPALQDFFNATEDVAAFPSSVPSRQAMLSASQSLVSRLHALQGRYAEIRQGVNDEITAGITDINSYAQQIANLNNQIVVAQSASREQPVNDLLDQRDQLVLELNKTVSATVVKQGDGTYNVFIGNGQALVVGGNALSLKAAPLPNDPGRIGVAYLAGGSTVWIPESSLQGGALGGYLAFRSGTLDTAQNALGRIALGLAQKFNDQHKLGQDLQGVLGTDYFSVPTPTVIGNGANAAASTITAAVTNVDALTTSDYRFSYAGGTYTLTRLSDGTSTSGAAVPLTLDGVTVSAATMNAGESFLVQPTREAARLIDVKIKDTAKIAAAAPIRTSAALANTGTAQISAGAITGTLPGANPQPSVTIEFVDDTHYRLVDTATSAVLVGSTVYGSGSDITYAANGWTVQITGTPKTGDTFVVGPNGNGTADNRNALALAQLATRNTLIGGTATFQSAYGQLVSDIGNKTRELQVTSEAQSNLLAQTSQSQEALSGVNLDEEAASLMRYQQAYQAAGKVLQIASRLFDTVLDLGG